MAEEWGAPAPHISQWLAAISQRLETARGPLWNHVTDPKSKLHFEYPIVGRGGPADDLLLRRRIDLLVSRPRNRVIVVDFKAGGKSPNSLVDVLSGASLQTYGPQLDSYRDALDRMGPKVDAVALWFVRTGAVVMW